MKFTSLNPQCLLISRRLAWMAVCTAIILGMSLTAPAQDNPAGALPQKQTSSVDSGFRKGPYLIYPKDNTKMKVLWQISSTETNTLQWGTDNTYSQGNVSVPEYGSDHQHQYTISNLTPGMLYYYRVLVDGGAGVRTGTFRAAPASNATSVKFMVYGDTRASSGDPANHSMVAGQMINTYTNDPAYQTLVLNSGDVVHYGNDESSWDGELFNTSYPNLTDLLEHVPYEAAMGNHDGDGTLFSKYFPYPYQAAHYWSFDYGPAHIACIDQFTASYGSGSTQYQWLENDLASSNKPWKFVILHMPGYSANISDGSHPDDPTVQNDIQPLCAQYGVAILFAGHTHYYARAVVNGVDHVTTGGGGAPLATPLSGQPYVVITNSSFHYCKVDIEGGLLTLTAKRADGSTIESFTLGSSASNLVVTLTPSNPPITIPSQGGSFNFNASAVDQGQNQTAFQVWARIKYPNGSYTSPTLGPVLIDPPLNVTVARQRTQNIPGTWPAGTYSYIGYANSGYSYPAADSSSFTFTKSVTAGSGPWITDASNSGDPFPYEVTESGTDELEATGNAESQIPVTINPNPFNPTTAIGYQLSARSYVSLRVYDVAGRLVATLVDGMQETGTHQAIFDGSKLVSGVYLYSLTVGDKIATGKMTLTK